MTVLFFLVLNFSVGYLAFRLARTVETRDPYFRNLIAACLFPCLVLLFSFAANALGRVDRWTMSLLVGAVALLCALQARLGIFGQRRYPDRLPPREQAAIPAPDSLVGLYLLSIVLTPVAVRALFGPTSFDWDDLWYRATTVGQWFGDGKLSLAPADYHAYFPKNAEVVSLWFLLPFGRDSYVGLAPLLWATIAAGAIVVVAKNLANSLNVGLAVAALFLVSPVVRTEIHTFASPDLAGTAFCLAALAVASRKRPDSPRARWGLMATAGLFSGFALGCKISFAPCVAVLGGFATIKGGEKGAGRFSSLFWFGVGVLLTGSFWYLRTWSITGNPIFPAEFGPFKGPFLSGLQSTTRLTSLLADASSRPEELVALSTRLLDWPVSLALLALGGYIFSLWKLQQSGRSTEHRTLALLLLAVGTTSALLYPFTPFSGGTDVGGAKVFLRYALFPFGIGIALLAAAYPTTRNLKTLWFWLCVAGVVTAWRGTGADGLSSLAGILIAFFLLAALRSSGSRAACTPTTLGVASLLVLLILVGLEPIKAQRTERYLFDQTFWSQGSGWRELDALPPGSRIAYFGLEGRRYYPVFGRRFQHTPVPVLEDGTPFTPVHDRWREGRYRWMPSKARRGWRETIRGEELIANLSRAKIDHIFISRVRGRGWPLQHRLLLGNPAVEVVYESEKALLLDLAMLPAPPSQ